MAVKIGMQQNHLPIGFANHHKDRSTDHWSYHMIAERRIAYKHGTINEVQVEGIERNLERIIAEKSVLSLHSPLRLNHGISKVVGGAEVDEP